MTHTRVTSARARALTLLEEVDRGRRLDVAWDSASAALTQRERAWVREVVFGTIRLRGRLDHLLNLQLHKGLRSVPATLLRVLRLGAYQVLYMRTVPRYAAVSQTTQQGAIAGGPKAAGLVNAVLRAVGEAGADPSRFPSFDEDPMRHLSSWGSHPRWLVERWIQSFGPAGAQSIVEAGNRIPEIFLRPIGIDTERATKVLRGRGIEVSPSAESTRILKLPPNLWPMEALSAAPGIIQDPAAAMTADFAAGSVGERVADLCAAPGGKGIAIVDSGAWVVGLDRSLGRLRLMQTSLRRLDLPQRLVVARAESPPLRPVDAVLVDAPCTGTGTLARHPDARWRLTPEMPAQMATVQVGILRGAATIVRPGGRLIYSTCTLEAEENEEVVESFLENHRDFALEDERSFLRIYPGERGTDGAFAARLRRIS